MKVWTCGAGVTRLLRAAAAALLAVAITAGAANGHASAMTAEEKYKALLDQGIFHGMPDGDPALDKEMSRAQAAKIIALLLNLESDEKPSAAKFTDVSSDHWAFDYIEAAAKEGIMIGIGGAQFDPSADMTVEQLAVILVRSLGIEPDEDASVEGASDWAAPYVAAAIEAGILPPQTDYRRPAQREQLVESSYDAYSLFKTSNGDPVDQAYAATGKPVLQLTSGDSVTTEAAYTISGTVYPRSAIISVNGSSVSTDDIGRWHASLTLKPGVNAISVHAVDEHGAESAAAAEVVYAAPLIVQVPDSRSGTVGVYDSFTLSVKDEGSSPLRYAASGLPAGLAIDEASGTISGTPSAAGSYAVSVTASAETGQSVTFTIIYTIREVHFSIPYTPPADTIIPIISAYSETVTVGEAVYGTSNESGTIYLTFENIADKPSVSQLESMVTEGRAAKQAMTANVEFTFDTALLTPGSYNLYAADAAGNVSDCAFVFLMADTSPPELLDVTELASHPIGQAVEAASNEDGWIYLVDGSLYNLAVLNGGITQAMLDDLSSSEAARIDAEANQPAAVPTDDLAPGSYQVLAVDRYGNISDPWPNSISLY